MKKISILFSYLLKYNKYLYLLLAIYKIEARWTMDLSTVQAPMQRSGSSGKEKVQPSLTSLD